MRALLPYSFLSTARLAQLKLQDSKDYYERVDRRLFFYRAFNLLYKNQISGDYAEFGCYGGMTFVLAFQNSRRFSHPKFVRKYWAFDSFQGLPAQRDNRDSHPSWVKGLLKTTQDEFVDICTGAEIPRSAYEMVPGFYQDTIGYGAKTPAKNLPDDIALAYIDCDLYSSTQSVLEFLSTRMKHGMILAFDDYYCYSSTAASGERLALLDYAKSVKNRFQFIPFVQYSYAGMSFVVEDRKFTGTDEVVLLSH
jgi:O-methyltransferase